ncbi:hypothetical protein GCM10023405_03440 [Streptomonospora salina]
MPEGELSQAVQERCHGVSLRIGGSAAVPDDVILTEDFISFDVWFSYGLRVARKGGATGQYVLSHLEKPA